MYTVKTPDGNGSIISIECHLANSLPNIVVVGIAHRSVDEARERIRGALVSSEIKLPRKRIVINLAPADIPKSGASFDLPMLVSILLASNQIKHNPTIKTVVIGEVGLDGSIRSVRGIIGKILVAKDKGFDSIIIPAGNLCQSMLIPGIYIYAFENIRQLYDAFNNSSPPKPIKSSGRLIHKDSDEIYTEDIVGQETAKRALLIAAAGHHNILLTGPPGTGKSMLARTLPGLLPVMSPKEILETTHLHSLANKEYDEIITYRPFRAPHHSASRRSIVGGGSSPKPGEISLSHNGVLLFDELPEFNRETIESLRQPLEDKEIRISRLGGSVTFPSDFLFIATSNPCPCGYNGLSKLCTCKPFQIQQYVNKISGPLLDRIDIYAESEPIPYSELLTSHNVKDQIDPRQIISKARRVQINRSGKLNNQLSRTNILQSSMLLTDAKSLLDQVANRYKMSARAYLSVMRIACTIADLDGSSSISTEHVGEALQFRKKT